MAQAPFSNVISGIVSKLQQDASAKLYKTGYLSFGCLNNNKFEMPSFLRYGPLHYLHGACYQGCSSAQRIALDIQLNYVNMVKRALAARCQSLSDHYCQALGRIEALADSGGIFNAIVTYVNARENINAKPTA